MITTNHPDTEKLFLFDRTINDWPVSSDEAVASLLQTLKELKSDLLSPPASQVRKTASICWSSVSCSVFFGLQHTCQLIDWLPSLSFSVKHPEKNHFLPWGWEKRCPHIVTIWAYFSISLLLFCYAAESTSNGVFLPRCTIIYPRVSIPGMCGCCFWMHPETVGFQWTVNLLSESPGVVCNLWRAVLTDVCSIASLGAVKGWVSVFWYEIHYKNFSILDSILFTR